MTYDFGGYGGSREKGELFHQPGGIISGLVREAEMKEAERWETHWWNIVYMNAQMEARGKDLPNWDANRRYINAIKRRAYLERDHERINYLKDIQEGLDDREAVEKIAQDKRRRERLEEMNQAAAEYERRVQEWLVRILGRQTF